MEMASSAISDLRPFVRRRDLLPGVNGGLERSQFSRYGPLDLASPDRFWIFCLCCRGEDYPRSFCPGCYVLDNGDSYSRLSSDVHQAVRLLFPPAILVLVLCRCWLTTLMVTRVPIALALWFKLKLWDNLIGIYKSMVCYLCHFLWLPSEKYKIVSCKNKKFENLKALLVS